MEECRVEGRAESHDAIIMGQMRGNGGMGWRKGIQEGFGHKRDRVASGARGGMGVENN